MKIYIYIYIYICYTKFVTMEKDLGVCVFETLREREREREREKEIVECLLV